MMQVGLSEPKGRHLGIPIVESPYMTWRDEPIIITQPAPGIPSAVTPLLVVGDAAFFMARIETAAKVRSIVREGLRDVIRWLHANGHTV